MHRRFCRLSRRSTLGHDVRGDEWWKKDGNGCFRNPHCRSLGITLLFAEQNNGYPGRIVFRLHFHMHLGRVVCVHAASPLCDIVFRSIHVLHCNYGYLWTHGDKSHAWK